MDPTHFHTDIETCDVWSLELFVFQSVTTSEYHNYQKSPGEVIILGNSRPVTPSSAATFANKQGTLGSSLGTEPLLPTGIRLI